MKERILKQLESGQKTFEELKKNLGLESFNESKTLDRMLRQLWNEKKVFYKKSRNTYNLKNDEEVIGTFRETKNDYAFVETEEMGIFIPGKFVLNALNGDTVKVILFSLREDDDPSRRAGKVVRVMQRNGSAIIGRVTMRDFEKAFLPDDLAPKYEYNVPNLNMYNEGDILMTKFVDFVDKVIELKIVRMIGSSENATLDPEIIGYKFELRTEFEEDVLAAAENVIPIDSPRRRDITDRLVYTIDGVESKDLDDAVDVKMLDNGNYRLGVHIADVSHFVREGSPIDEEAVARGTSVYLIDTVFPMLPRKISNDICSLNPDVMKFTMSFDMEITKDGQVVNTEVFESKIISKHRLSYVQVDELYNGTVDMIATKELSDSLLLAKELSEILRAVKIKNGMIDFVLAEAKVSLDEDGQVIEIKNKFQTESEKVIEDLMVVTNENVAKKFDKKGLPGVFRVHPSPKEESLETFNRLAKTLGAFLPKSPEEIKSKDLMQFLEENGNSEHEAILKRYMIQTMEKAIYLQEDNGHYALGLESYLHFTSPIRRYPDLVVHRLLKEFFLDENAGANRKGAEDKIHYLTAISKDTSDKERVAVSAERRLVDIKKSRFMKKFEGDILPGKTVSVVKFGFFVEFENLTQGLVHIDNLRDDDYKFDEVKFGLIGSKTKNVYQLGKVLDVKIKNVDVVRGLVDLEVA